MERLAIIKKILTAATDAICDNLNPKDILRTMKSKDALSANDCKKIESKVTEGDQAEEMLNILMTKPASAYETFVETLHDKGREDIYRVIKNLEAKHGYDRPGKVSLP